MGGTKEGQANPALYNALCRSCHRWVEMNPFEARRYGYKVARGKRLEDAPYRTWSGWITADSNGSSATHECSDDEGPSTTPA
jgi:hypothetical protein